jgi:hypothetical protein
VEMSCWFVLRWCISVLCAALCSQVAATPTTIRSGQPSSHVLSVGQHLGNSQALTRCCGSCIGIDLNNDSCGCTVNLALS